MMNDALHVVHPRAAGLDVHKMEITATVRLCDEPGEPVCETRSFSALPPGLDELAEWLVGHEVSAAAMEGTGVYWRAPWDRLSEAGIEVQLLHAQHVKQLRGRKTDVEDSRWLARVCQFGLGRPSLVPDRTFLALRSLSRHRRSLVQERARVRNRVQKVIDRAGVRIGGIISDVFGVNGRIMLDGLIAGDSREVILGRLSHHVSGKLATLGSALTFTLADWERELLRDLVSAEAALQTRMQAVQAMMLERLEPHREALELLQTMPGIDRVAAASILAETGPDMSVFGSVQAFAAWAGLCPGNNETAGKRRHGATRRGSRHPRATLVEAAHAATNTRNCQFAGFKRSVAARRGNKRALVAAAHKIARILYVILRDRAPYRDPDTNYEALMVNRNASRWLRQLGQFGILESRGDGNLRVNWDTLKAAPKRA